MRIKNQLEYRDNAAMQLRGLYFGSFQPDSKTQFENKKVIFDFLKEKKLPQNIITWLQGYDNALYDLFMKEKVIFLYEVDGQLYKTKNSVNVDLPCWDTLPREKYDALGVCGGFYHRDSLKRYS